MLGDGCERGAGEGVARGDWPDGLGEERGAGADGLEEGEEDGADGREEGAEGAEGLEREPEGEGLTPPRWANAGVASVIIRGKVSHREFGARMIGLRGSMGYTTAGKGGSAATKIP